MWIPHDPRKEETSHTCDRVKQMATYLLISLNGSREAVDAAVQEKIPREDALKVESGKWLLRSANVTSKEVSDSLEIPDAQTYIVVPVKGYFGVARPEVWEWLAAKTTVNA
jgi:hypothetical protein